MDTLHNNIIRNLHNPDAVIVLAHHMDERGNLNLESQLRAKKSAELFQERKALTLLTTGWAYRKNLEISIAEAFKLYLVSNLNIEVSRIATEINSRDTVGDAYFTKVNYAVPLSWRHICVVTSDYHVERTREIFNFVYGDSFDIEVYGVEFSSDKSLILKELESVIAFRNTFADAEKGNDFQIFEHLQHLHPLYNGVIHN